MTVRLALTPGRVELIHPPPPEDDIHVLSIYTNPIILTHLPSLPPVITLDDVARQRIARTTNERYREFRIHHQSGEESLPKVLGVLGFLNIDTANHSADVGITIAPEVHRKGYATEALLLLLQHGFSPESEGGLNLHRIAFGTSIHNVGMRGWLEQTLCATRESTLREIWKSADGWIDGVGYSILKSEWETAKARLEARLEKVIPHDRKTQSMV